MTQRNFPPSFWDPHICNTLSNSYLDSNPLPFNTSNPYLSSATLHGISSLHQVAAASPWHYPISSHSQGSYHRPSPATHMHYDFSYSSMAAAAAAAASSRFSNTHGQYNPLIMPHHPVATASQPATATAMRSASGPFNSMPGQHCDISGKSAADLPTTARRFVEYPSHTNLEPVLTGKIAFLSFTLFLLLFFLLPLTHSLFLLSLIQSFQFTLFLLRFFISISSAFFTALLSLCTSFSFFVFLPFCSLFLCVVRFFHAFSLSLTPSHKDRETFL